MNNYKALNKIIPDRLMTEGNIGLGDLLRRIADWTERVPILILDEEAYEAQKEAGGGNPVGHRAAPAPRKTIFPGGVLSRIIRKFLDSEAEETCEYKIKFGPEFIGIAHAGLRAQSVVIAEGEARIQQRNTLLLVPLPFPESIERPRHVQSWQTQSAPEVEGMGSASKPREVSTNR